MCCFHEWKRWIDKVVMLVVTFHLLLDYYILLNVAERALRETVRSV